MKLQAKVIHNRHFILRLARSFRESKHDHRGIPKGKDLRLREREREEDHCLR